MRCYSFSITIRLSGKYDIGSIVINNITSVNDFYFFKIVSREKALDMIAETGLKIEKDDILTDGFVARKTVCKIV